MNPAAPSFILVGSILILGFITFLYRFAFMSSIGQQLSHKIPNYFFKILAPATFTAIITQSFLNNQNESQDLKTKFLTLIISVFIAYRTRSVLLTVIFGLSLLYGLEKAQW